jgi:RNA polymerase sigma-70 factor, ECF subfamily
MAAMVMGESFESVLMAAQAGGEWAFAELYDSYNPLLERYFAARASSVAEDLAAETWMGAARTLEKFRGGETQFRSWLFTIAHHVLADYWKEGRRWGWVQADREALVDYLAPDDPERSVLDSLSGRAAARKIAAMLPPEQAEVVLLRVVGGLDVDQVAKIIGRRPGTVRVLQHRALKKLSKDFSLEPVTE